MKSVVIHYQEIALKGKNRPWFVARLVKNIREAVRGLDIAEVRVLMGRIELVLGPETSWEAVRDRLSTVFGIANFAKAGRTALDIDAIAAEILKDLGPENPATFRVTARRADKRFPLTSPQIEREVGGRIKEARGWTVNLDEPELTIHLEALTKEAFYSFSKDRGPGGLPVGASGRVTCLLSGGIDSPVAAWRMMRRGCRVQLRSLSQLPDSVARLPGKGPGAGALAGALPVRSRLFMVPFGAIQQQVVLAVPPPLRVVVYRRLMMRIAERIAKRQKSQALVTGDVVGQVASQTIENMAVDRQRRVAAGAAAARRDGQGRNHRGGAAPRHLRDLDHARRGLLHAVHSTSPGHEGPNVRGRARRSQPADRRDCHAGG